MSLPVPAENPAQGPAGGPAAPAPHRSMLSRASPLIIARLASAMITFIIPLALARAFVAEDYGTYKQLILISTTLYFILPFGMSQSLYYFVPRAPAARPYVIQTLGFLLVVGGLGAGAMVLWAGPLAQALNNPGIGEYLPLLALYTFALVGSMPLEPTLTARGRTGTAGAVYVLSDLVKALAMTLPALLGHGLHGVVLGIAGFALVRLVATWAVLLPGSGPLFNRAALAEQLRYAIPFGFAVAVAVPQRFFHQAVVASGLDPAMFAVYAVGIFQVPLFDLLYTPTSEMLMVHLAELDREGRPASEGAAAFRDSVLRLAWYFIPGVLFLFTMAPEFITALFTERYAAAVPVFRIGVGVGLLACIPVEGALRARGQTRHILVSNIVKAVVMVPLVLLGVARFGMVGGVGSWVIAEVIGKAVLIARLPRALLSPLGALLPWRDLGRQALAASIALLGVAGARLLLGGTQAPPLAVLCLAAGFYGALYLGATLALGARLSELPLPWRRQAAAAPARATGR